MEEVKSSVIERGYMSVDIQRDTEKHWVTGSCGDYRFSAKVYDIGSKYGINGGRVSKLEIRRVEKNRGNQKKTVVANYDRGWDIKPESSGDSIACRIIHFCLEYMLPEQLDNESDIKALHLRLTYSARAKQRQTNTASTE